MGTAPWGEGILLQEINTAGCEECHRALSRQPKAGWAKALSSYDNKMLPSGRQGVRNEPLSGE
jgi:hypothetical protein